MMYTAAAKLNSPTAQHVSLLFGGQQSALENLQQLALETLYTKGTAMVVKGVAEPIYSRQTLQGLAASTSAVNDSPARA